ncbi:thioesterase II family protein [Plantactinospora sp. WMMC1484]|uniref:thioesterase II family protein n=1 Tax=Plantactinospora sp. WMMC1484 TaxID=3404122 RepID=UPI003BF49AC7
MSRWLRSLRPSGTGRTVIAFPHAGGTASYFAPFARQMPAGVGLTAVQYPGRADRMADPFLEDLPRLADQAAEALRRHPGDIVLFGHSLGARIAQEVALRLPSVRGLVVSGHEGPANTRPVTEHLLPDEELWARIRGLRGTAEGVMADAHLRDLLLPVFRSDFRLAAGHKPPLGRDLKIPVVACVGDSDPEVSPPEVMSWQYVTTGRFTLHVFPRGDHFYLAARPAEVMRAAADLLPEPHWPSTP